ncbi:MAG: AmmeMemoRadiSam system protein B [Holophagae bacterium]|jgi:hypothetical protein
MKALLTLLLLMAASTAGAGVRPPAVAGSFYTEDPAGLRAEVERYLGSGPPQSGVRALVVPHAGYVFSGAVAGTAFAALDGDAVHRVVLLGPSHHRGFRGAALPDPSVTSFATPLGDVPLDVQVLERLRGLEGFGGPPAAHDPEHSLEVELPFLQVAAPKAKIVPVLLGNGTDLELAGKLARTLSSIVDENTIVVVSSDFTHHGENYGWTPFSGPDLPDQLLRLGRETAALLAAPEPVGFAHQVEVSGDTVCGAKPSMVLAELLRHAFAGSGEVEQVTTSGHVSGRWDLSVTYASIIYRGAWSPWRTDETPALGEVEAEQGARMASLARATLESYLLHDGSVASWYLDRGDDSLSRTLAGAFVTLNRKGTRPGDPRRLRACMGVVEATQPLERAVVQAAVWAAQDPRFPRLKANELEEISVEVSILSPRRRVPGPGAIEVGVHGVLLRKGAKQALFLPQVATEQGWNRRQMLDQLARKAGLPADGWRNGAEFEVFTAQVFEEAH